MVRVLLDTCVISELRRPHPDIRVVDQVAAIDTDNLYMCVVTLGELLKGIVLLDSGARKDELSTWLLNLEQTYADRILPIDAEISRIWGEITAVSQKKGIQIPASDGLIAATALRHGLHVITRNSRHFAATGVLIIDPWET